MPKGISRMTPIFVCMTLLALLGMWVLWDIRRSNYEEHIDENAAQRLRNETLPNQQTRVQAATPVAVLPAHLTAERLPASNVLESMPNAPALYLCQHVRTAAPAMSGDIDGWEWGRAQPLEFVRLDSHAPARSRTAARLLWDDQYLYFSAVMDDADVYANNTQHNGMLWLDDVFELFFKPDANKLGYYEFEINPRNATMEMYMPSRGSGGYGRWIGKRQFHVESKVTLRPGTTLNDPSDRDAGWIVEGRIPWSDFGPTGGKPAAGAAWKFALCRMDYSVEYDAVEQSSSTPLKETFHNYENYAVIKFVQQP